jgi:hypothetical protein
MNFGVIFEVYELSYIPIMLMVFSTATTFIYSSIYSAVPKSVGSNVFTQIFSSPHFWLTFHLILVACFIPRLAIGYYFRAYKPNDIQIAKELEREMNHKTDGNFSLKVINPTIDSSNQSKTCLANHQSSAIRKSATCRPSIEKRASLGLLSIGDSVITPGESTLEITDIHHARDSASLPPVTIPIILTPQLIRRASQLSPRY